MIPESIGDAPVAQVNGLSAMLLTLVILVNLDLSFAWSDDNAFSFLVQKSTNYSTAVVVSCFSPSIHFTIEIQVSIVLQLTFIQGNVASHVVEEFVLIA